MVLWHVSSESPGSTFGIKASRVWQNMVGDGSRPSIHAGRSGVRGIPDDNEGQGERIPEKETAVLETGEFGRVLLVKDQPVRGSVAEDPYHEMMVHVPVNSHPDPRNALVIGGSDGAVLERLAAYKSIARVTLAGVDETVARVAAAWYPAAEAAFNDSRVSLVRSDAPGYVRDCRERFDLVILDPVLGLNGPEFPQSFFSDCFRVLSGDGVLVCDLGGVDHAHARRETATVLGKIRRLFPVFRPFCVPGRLPGMGGRLLGFASKTLDPVAGHPANRWREEGVGCLWYNSAMHKAAFALPESIEEILKAF